MISSIVFRCLSPYYSELIDVSGDHFYVLRQHFMTFCKSGKSFIDRHLFLSCQAAFPRILRYSRYFFTFAADASILKASGGRVALYSTL
jgi:hypothetical protein